MPADPNELDMDQEQQQDRQQLQLQDDPEDREAELMRQHAVLFESCKYHYSMISS